MSHTRWHCHTCGREWAGHYSQIEPIFEGQCPICKSFETERLTVEGIFSPAELAVQGSAGLSLEENRKLPVLSQGGEAGLNTVALPPVVLLADGGIV